jgi:hypothetical protein
LKNAESLPAQRLAAVKGAAKLRMKLQGPPKEKDRYGHALFEQTSKLLAQADNTVEIAGLQLAKAAKNDE